MFSKAKTSSYPSTVLASYSPTLRRLCIYTSSISELRTTTRQNAWADKQILQPVCTTSIIKQMSWRWFKKRTHNIYPHKQYTKKVVRTWIFQTGRIKEMRGWKKSGSQWSFVTIKWIPDAACGALCRSLFAFKRCHRHLGVFKTSIFVDQICIEYITFLVAYRPTPWSIVVNHYDSQFIRSQMCFSQLYFCCYICCSHHSHKHHRVGWRKTWHDH